MFRKALAWADRALSFFEEWTLFLTVLVALVALFVSVVTRYLMTYTMTWPEELVREVIVYSTFVGCAVGVKNRALIRIDALPNLFPRLKKPLDFINHTVVLAFGVFVTWIGFKLVHLVYVTKQSTIILKIPQVVLFSILPLMGFLTVVRLIQVVTEDLTGKPIRE